MNRDNIIVKNAYTNNLRNIDIEIPKHKLVVFTGVSGSGKSSLLFDTIDTEPFQIKNTGEKLTYNRTFEGLVRKLEKAVTSRADDESAEEEKNAYSKFFSYLICGHCNGTRLNEQA